MKKIIEKDLINLGFEKQYQTAESSGADHDWHYYTLDIGEICFMSCDSDEAEELGWFVRMCDFETFLIDNKSALEHLIEIIKNCTK